MSINTNLSVVKDKISKACSKVGRNPADITIIGVTKYVSSEKANELINAGIVNLGENRTENVLEKQSEIKADVKWHFIGTLQSRKVKDIIDKVDMIHSLDRESVAKQIHSRANKVMDCFVQVNVSEERSKHGLLLDEVETFIKDLEKYENIRLVGLMTMAPHSNDENEIRPIFQALKEKQEALKALNLPHAPMTSLSMGMSNDYEIAIEEGATHIRLGSTLVKEA